MIQAINTVSMKRDDISHRPWVMCRCSPSATILGSGKILPWGALNSHFEASGSASGNGIEKSGCLYIYSSLVPRLRPLAPTRNKKGGLEPGTGSQLILRHDYVTAMITNAVTQLCSHVLADSNSYAVSAETSELWLRRWDLSTTRTAATAERSTQYRRIFNNPYKMK